MLKNERLTAVYCRVASASDEDRFAIESQKNSVLRFAEKHGCSNTVCYLDNGCSGLTLDRPEFSRLCDDILAGKIATVVVRDLSRIGRDIIATSKWLDWLGQQEVEFMSADGYKYADAGIFVEIQKAFEDFTRRERAAKRKMRAASSNA